MHDFQLAVINEANADTTLQRNEVDFCGRHIALDTHVVVAIRRVEPEDVKVVAVLAALGRDGAEDAAIELGIDDLAPFQLRNTALIMRLVVL